MLLKKRILNDIWCVFCPTCVFAVNVSISVNGTSTAVSFYSLVFDGNFGFVHKCSISKQKSQKFGGKKTLEMLCETLRSVNSASNLKEVRFSFKRLVSVLILS